MKKIFINKIFCNDHVIIKISTTKIWRNLEPYGKLQEPPDGDATPVLYNMGYCGCYAMAVNANRTLCG